MRHCQTLALVLSLTACELARPPSIPTETPEAEPVADPSVQTTQQEPAPPPAPAIRAQPRLQENFELVRPMTRAYPSWKHANNKLRVTMKPAESVDAGVTRKP